MHSTATNCPDICVASNKGIVIKDNSNSQINLTASCSLDTPAGAATAAGEIATVNVDSINSDSVSFIDDPVEWVTENWLISGLVVLLIIIIIGTILFIV